MKMTDCNYSTAPEDKNLLKYFFIIANNFPKLFIINIFKTKGWKLVKLTVHFNAPSGCKHFKFGGSFHYFHARLARRCVVAETMLSCYFIKRH